MKKKKRVLIVGILLFVLLCIIGIDTFCYWLFPTKITLKDNSIKENKKHIILKNSNLLWDTGSNGTYIFMDFGQKNFPVAISIDFDYSYKIKFNIAKYSNCIEMDSAKLQNIIYKDIGVSDIPQWYKNEKNGILGMNVINNYNWIVDFDKNTLQNLPKTTIYNHTPQFTLRYSNAMIPKTTVSIGGVKIKNVLIDSGFNSDIMLLTSDIEQIDRHINPDTIYDTFTSGMFSDRIPNKAYRYTNIEIAGMSFDTISIIDGPKRLIGTGFFRKFDRVFWDSGNREVRFYKD